MPGSRGCLRERLGLFLVGAVGSGQPFPVLAQVLVPRGDDEDLLEFAGLFAVAEQPPLGGAGPQPRLANASIASMNSASRSGGNE